MCQIMMEQFDGSILITENKSFWKNESVWQSFKIVSFKIVFEILLKVHGLKLNN